MKYLTVGDILKLHNKIINEIGGTPGIRDKKLLDSAVNSIKHTIRGKDLYPDVITKAVVLAELIIKNHPFVDGNKRVGITAMELFLELNGINASYIPHKVAYDIAVGFASGKLKREEAIKMIEKELKKNISETKDASEIYQDFKYLNLEGLDLSKYEKMDLEKGWDTLEKELLKRVKPGIKINDDVLDEIDSILMDVFVDKMIEEGDFEPWEEVNEKIRQMMEKEGGVVRS